MPKMGGKTTAHLNEIIDLVNFGGKKIVYLLKIGGFRNGTQQYLNKMVDMVKFWGAKRSSRCRKCGAKPRRIPTDSQRGSASPPRDFRFQPLWLCHQNCVKLLNAIYYGSFIFDWNWWAPSTLQPSGHTPGHTKSGLNRVKTSKVFPAKLPVNPFVSLGAHLPHPTRR